VTIYRKCTTTRPEEKETLNERSETKDDWLSCLRQMCERAIYPYKSPFPASFPHDIYIVLTVSLKGAELYFEEESMLQFQLPRDATGEMIAFFKAFELQKEALGVHDYSIGLSTMEEVFLNLSKTADEEEEQEDAKGT
jgi:hypothetical protein